MREIIVRGIVIREIGPIHLFSVPIARPAFSIHRFPPRKIPVTYPRIGSAYPRLTVNDNFTRRTLFHGTQAKLFRSTPTRGSYLRADLPGCVSIVPVFIARYVVPPRRRFLCLTTTARSDLYRVEMGRSVHRFIVSNMCMILRGRIASNLNILFWN